MNACYVQAWPSSNIEKYFYEPILSKMKLNRFGFSLLKWDSATEETTVKLSD